MNSSSARFSAPRARRCRATCARMSVCCAAFSRSSCVHRDCLGSMGSICISLRFFNFVGAGTLVDKVPAAVALVLLACCSIESQREFALNLFDREARSERLLDGPLQCASGACLPLERGNLAVHLRATKPFFMFLFSIQDQMIQQHASHLSSSGSSPPRRFSYVFFPLPSLHKCPFAPLLFTPLATTCRREQTRSGDNSDTTKRRPWRHARRPRSEPS